jgi:hypothetical protein
MEAHEFSEIISALASDKELQLVSAVGGEDLVDVVTVNNTSSPAHSIAFVLAILKTVSLDLINNGWKPAMVVEMWKAGIDQTDKMLTRTDVS